MADVSEETETSNVKNEAAFADSDLGDKDNGTEIKPDVVIDELEVNPWDVKAVSVFLHYCCPECPNKSKNLEAFLDHAKFEHEQRSQILFKNRTCSTEDDDNFDKAHPNRKRKRSDEEWYENEWSESKPEGDNDDLELKHDPEDTGELIDIVCPKCKVTFANDGDTFVEHFQDTHPFEVFPKGAIFTCLDCDFKGLHQEVNQHSQQTHKLAFHRYKCTKCVQRFKTRPLLLKHFKATHPEDDIKDGNIVTAGRTKIEPSNEVICHDCDASFANKDQLKSHQKRDHPKSSPYECVRCSTNFLLKENLIQHCKEVHEGDISDIEKVKCDNCKEVVVNDGVDMLNHYWTCHPHDLYPRRLVTPCDFCDFKDTLHRVNEHCIKEHGEAAKPYKCPECDKKYTRRMRLGVHFEADHSDNQNICEECGKVFGTRNGLVQHIGYAHKVDKKNPQIMCDKCEFRTTHKRYLNRHVQTMHVKEKLTKCDHCDKTFLYNSDLEAHIQSAHRDVDFSHYCIKCGKGFFHSSTFEKHMIRCKADKIPNAEEVKAKVSTKQRAPRGSKASKGDRDLSITCENCGEVLTQAHSFDDHHARKHPHLPKRVVGRTLHFCDICPHRSFTHPGGLRKHKYTAHGVHNKPNVCDVCNTPYLKVHKCLKATFSCTQCDRSFNKEMSLREHVQGVHMGHRPVQCDKCEKSFVTKRQLKAHDMYTHQKQQCKFCKNVLSSKWEYKRHLVLIHNETEGAYMCPHCPKGVFFSETMLRKHTKEKHMA